MSSNKHPIMRVHKDDCYASERIALALAEVTTRRGIVIVCVGTDRSTGDSLGPLVGSRLEEADLPGVHVYGTLEKPVHALNLEEHIELISKKHPRLPILAIDACLGRSESIGFVSLKHGSLKPGTGVNKTLPPVGDYHLVGVVNVGGFMEYFVLQNTRLSVVMSMAHIIFEGIRLSFQDWEKGAVGTALEQ